MNSLPSSIEKYLTEEAGFSSTEVLALRHLLRGEAMTLRELATKTGKSTGVLDQAIKKLLTRKILRREMVNDTPKFALASPEDIRLWMKKDLQEKQKILQRKEQDFESFVRSIEQDITRPQIEYFEGEEGLKKAYEKLLTLAEKELLFMCRVRCKEEEDPLRDFRVQHFRKRHKLGLFSRVLAPDSPLGRRYQSRDAFEYRKTLLLASGRFPVTFEKVIAGETVACFLHDEGRASFLHYPRLAASERVMFEMLWEEGMKEETRQGTVKGLSAEEKKISVQTKIFSALREFFLSRKSIAAFILCAVLAAAMTYGLCRQNAYLNLQRVRERAMAIAATAAVEFDAEDLEQLKTLDDIRKPEYAKVIAQLRNIRDRNENVVYIYIMRPTEEKNIFAFVADADSLDPTAQIDLNQDGMVDSADHLSPPGEPYYEGTQQPSLSLALEGPIANAEPTTDQWGIWISAQAPIHDMQGKAIAFIGVDFRASEVQELTQETFELLLYFFGFFILFVLIRLAAFNRSLLRDLWQFVNTKAVLITLAVCAFIALAITYGMYRYTLNLMKEEVGQRLMSIAATAAPEIDAKDLEALHIAKDMEKEEYQRVFKKLNEIRDRNQNEKIIYVYVMRPTEQENVWEFVADADSNYYIPVYAKDHNMDGIINEADENPAPGVSYDATGQKFVTQGLKGPMIEDFVIDQWGTLMSGIAPIVNVDGQPVAILGFDINLNAFYNLVKSRFSIYFWFFVSFGVLVTLKLILLVSRRR